MDTTELFSIWIELKMDLLLVKFKPQSTPTNATNGVNKTQCLCLILKIYIITIGHSNQMDIYSFSTSDLLWECLHVDVFPIQYRLLKGKVSMLIFCSILIIPQFLTSLLLMNVWSSFFTSDYFKPEHMID